MQHAWRLPLRLILSMAAVGCVTALYLRVVHVNPTTIALSYVIVVLLIATRWGLVESTAASLAAVLAFNFFFLPPVGTLTIADPQNWIALLAFLVTATVASQLSIRATQRTIEAVGGRRDLERLYALSRALLLAEGASSLPATIARHIASTFELRAVAVYDQRADIVAMAGSTDLPDVQNRLREVARRGVAMHDGDLHLLAVQLGGQPIGSLAILDSGVSDTVLQSIANLTAIWFERRRAAEAQARAEAARHSSELRAAVLDALAHELKTPLTSMKTASGELTASATIGGRNRELVTVLDQEVERLQTLVTDAVQMLRIDAGDFSVHPHRFRLQTVLAPALGRYQQHLDGRLVVTEVPDALTVDADRDLLSLALRQLIDNAVKYSPPDARIEIAAHTNAGVDITIRNSGSVIPPWEQVRILERYYRGERAREIPGTGMGLAIVKQIATAHGGQLAVSSSAEDGTTFTLSLPRGASAS